MVSPGSMDGIGSAGNHGDCDGPVGTVVRFPCGDRRRGYGADPERKRHSVPDLRNRESGSAGGLAAAAEMGMENPVGCVEN